MKYILAEFLLNFINIHWWIWIVLVFLGIRKWGAYDKIYDSLWDGPFSGGIGGLGGIYLFERYVGIEKSFGLVDFGTVIIMCIIVHKIVKKKSGISEGKVESQLEDEVTTVATVTENNYEASSSDSDARKRSSAKPIREIDRYSTGDPSMPSSVSSSTREKLEELKSLLDDGLINEEDYEKKKNDLLRKM